MPVRHGIQIWCSYVLYDIIIIFSGIFHKLAYRREMQNRITPLKLSLVAFEWTHSRAISGSRKIHFSPSFTGILRGWQLFKEIRKRRKERKDEEKDPDAGRENPDSFKCTISFASYRIMVNTGCTLLSSLARDRRWVRGREDETRGETATPLIANWLRYRNNTGGRALLAILIARSSLRISFVSLCANTHTCHKYTYTRVSSTCRHSRVRG